MICLARAPPAWFSAHGKPAAPHRKIYLAQVACTSAHGRYQQQQQQGQQQQRVPAGPVAPLVPSQSRRALNLQLLTLLGGSFLLDAAPAQASLVQFPATRLNNTYLLVRAGESNAEAEGYVLSNPVAKTSMTSGLSKKGIEQVVRQTYPAIKLLGEADASFWMWPSIAQNSYQTAEILASLSGMGRNRIVPEYSFLDARGVGALDRNPSDIVAAELARGDQTYGADWRPPPGVDGTPNESVADVMVRGRQLLSITETQYLGETVLIISPDSDNLSILQAAVLGTDLRAHDTLRFAPGEVRRLELSTLVRDDSPMQIPCPRPPQCR